MRKSDGPRSPQVTSSKTAGHPAAEAWLLPKQKVALTTRDPPASYLDLVDGQGIIRTNVSSCQASLFAVST